MDLGGLERVFPTPEGHCKKGVAPGSVNPSLGETPCRSSFLRKWRKSSAFEQSHSHPFIVRAGTATIIALELSLILFA